MMSSQVGASNNHNNNNKNNNNKAQIKTKSKSSTKQLTHEEIGDLDNTIEHLIAVGTQIQNQINRRKLYFEEINDTGSEEEEEENKSAAAAATLSLLEQEETATTTQTKKKKAKQQKDSKAKLLFTEDIRLYGNKSKMKRMEISRSYPCFEKNPWPQQPNSNSNQRSNTKCRTKYNLSMVNNNQNDKAWDIEYGDTIHPIAFSNSRLSRFINVNHQQKQIIDGENLSIGTTDISISSQDDIPRALLLRCWENAVHASSSTIYAPIMASSSHNHHSQQKNETSSSSSVVVAVEAAAAGAAASSEKQHKQQNLNDDDDDHNTNSKTQIGMKRKRQHQQNQQSSSSLYHNAIDSISKQGKGYRPRTFIEAKCKSLGIHLEDFKTNKKHRLVECPRCKSKGFDDGTKFADDALALQQHYYGNSKSKKNQTRMENGCCWSWLYEKQSNLVGRLLQNHIETQTELLLGLLFDQAAKKKKKVSTRKHDDDDGDEEEGNKMDDDNESTAEMKRRATTTKETAAKKSGGDVQEDTETKEKKKRLFNWKDVIDMFDDAINNSSSALSSNPSSSGRRPPLPLPQHHHHHHHRHHHPILETIQTSNNSSKKKKQEEAGASSSATTLSPPLLLNPMILESAKEALIERYGPNRTE